MYSFLQMSPYSGKEIKKTPYPSLQLRPSIEDQWTQLDNACGCKVFLGNLDFHLIHLQLFGVKIKVQSIFPLIQCRDIGPSTFRYTCAISRAWCMSRWYHCNISHLQRKLLTYSPRASQRRHSPIWDHFLEWVAHGDDWYSISYFSPCPF